MAHTQHTLSLANLEEAVTVLFCLIDDAYRLLNPSWRSHDSLKRLSDSEVLALALFQQLRGVESEDRSCATLDASSRICSRASVTKAFYFELGSLRTSD